MLQICVPGGQHGRETRHFFLAAAFFTRLFEMPVIADDFKRAFAVDFFLKPAQRTIHGFTFFQSNFCHRNSLPSSGENLPSRTGLAKQTRRIVLPPPMSMRKNQLIETRAHPRTAPVARPSSAAGCGGVPAATTNPQARTPALRSNRPSIGGSVRMRPRSLAASV